ncbi:MAG: DUF2357 domain-containing protein [Bacilli bacterium]|nr:DUF2357 domain-containing protein [Bacilli bacterium]
MIKNITDIMNNVNNNELELFMSNTDANFSMKSDIRETKVDYSWINVLEDTLSSLDKIVRNPRRFIVQEEDVVIVEKIKRVSLETIKHLAVHSENIQSLDENGDVVPKKLLNVHKEDTSDLYENRFIYTLVTRLESFINRQLDALDLESKCEIKKSVVYNAQTKIDNRNINIELKLEDDDIIFTDDEGEDYKTRILACYEIINAFKSTEMIKELIGCSLVSNPIRKTNLILREPNFQKAFILWEYLDNYELREPKVVNYESITNNSDDIKNEFTLSYFINSNAIKQNKENLLQYKDTDNKLKKLINDYIYENDNDINKLTNKAFEYYNNALVEKHNREIKIEDIYNIFISKNKSIIEDIYSFLNN